MACDIAIYLHHLPEIRGQKCNRQKVIYYNLKREKKKKEKKYDRWLWEASKPDTSFAVVKHSK